MTQAVQLTVRGMVQGIGMRPWVVKHGQSLGLAGSVQNCAHGVAIELEGETQALQQFVRTLQQQPPAGADIEGIDTRPATPSGITGFRIQTSIKNGTHSTQIPKDRAMCDACRREQTDPNNRRYQHPFISCVACGPRFTIVEGMPFDRANTAMSAFAMCDACRREYEDPQDRRYHAQTISCHDCGPRLRYQDFEHTLHGNSASLQAALEDLRRGGILALKGVGGYQLLCDATDDAALNRLRAWKDRRRKPFAVMTASVDQALSICTLSGCEQSALTSTAAPIVVAKRRAATSLSPRLAPDLHSIGVMLPASGLHQLLADLFGGPLVVTSANRGGEPLLLDDDKAAARLANIADAVLWHDRQIHHMADDSVLRFAGERRILMRHARGFAPTSVPAADQTGPGVALGGHIKSAAAISTGSAITLLQHIGDLGAVETQDRLLTEASAIASNVLGAAPAWSARDLHPDYGSADVAQRLSLPEQLVPHHLAHTLSLLAEQNIELPVLGVAFDGTGLGTDRTIWGGEFIQVCRAPDDHAPELRWQRVGSIVPFPLPGGDAAVREPRRAALGVAWRLVDGQADRLPECVRALFNETEWHTLTGMLASDINCPSTSSVGRLFDAVAAMLGYCATADYDGEAAILLEQAACTGSAEATTTTVVKGARWDWRPTLTRLLEQFEQRAPRADLAASFHQSLADMICTMCTELGAERVLLSGGVFQNAMLVQLACTQLSAAGKQTFTHHNIPPNDGGLALGQAFAAATGCSQTETPRCV